MVSKGRLRLPGGGTYPLRKAAGILPLAILCWLCLGYGVQAWGQLPGLPGAEEAAAKQQGEEPPASRPSFQENVQSFWQRLELSTLWRENSYLEWAILAGCILAGMVLGKLAAVILRGIGSRWEKKGWEVRGRFFSDLAGPLHLGLISLGLAVGVANLKLSPLLQEFSGRTLLLLYAIAVFWYAYNLVGVLDIPLRRLTARTASKLDDQLVPLIRKSLRLFVVVVGVLFVVDSVFQWDIGAWLAGLGIAGLAVSLAAQDSLKNLFGSLTIILDQPFAVGDRIVYAGYDGVIEEVGFRSVKMRTLTGHLVTIPNSTIVNSPVENISQRPSIRRILDIGLTYDTPPEKIRQVVERLREILQEPEFREPLHFKVGQDEYAPRVYFTDFNADNLNVRVIYWFHPPAYWDYLEHGQRLNLRIMQELEALGVEFAFPTQTLYLAGDPQRELQVTVHSPPAEGASG